VAGAGGDDEAEQLLAQPDGSNGQVAIGHD
jgi:hypothetical protein